MNHKTEEMIGGCESASTVPKRSGGPGFSKWEMDFLGSVREQFDARGRLTEKQIEILEGMWDRT